MDRSVQNGWNHAVHTAHRIVDEATDGVKEQSAKLEARAVSATDWLPRLSKRVVDALLDRLPLERKGSAGFPIGAFAVGAVVGGVFGALVTPVAGPKLRKSIVEGVRALSADLWSTADEAIDDLTGSVEHAANTMKKAAAPTTSIARKKAEGVPS